MLRYVYTQKPASKNPSENRIVFVDRDGVINVDPIGDYVKRWADFKFEKNAMEALKEISRKDYEIIIISNQAGIGDHVYPEAALREIHENMVKELESNGIHIRSAHYCLHGKTAGCHCRKPETGLFEDATKGLNFLKAKTYLIGDKATDVEGGKRFGIKTIMVRTGHGAADEKKLKIPYFPDHIVDSIADAAGILPR